MIEGRSTITSVQEAGNPPSDDLIMFVLDVARHDISDVDRILDLVNDHHTFGWRDRWGRHFSRDEVRLALEALLARDWIRPLAYDASADALVESNDPDASLEDLWFVVTRDGLRAWERWTPPV